MEGDFTRRIIDESATDASRLRLNSSDRVEKISTILFLLARTCAPFRGMKLFFSFSIVCVRVGRGTYLRSSDVSLTEAILIEFQVVRQT